MTPRILNSGRGSFDNFILKRHVWKYFYGLKIDLTMDKWKAKGHGRGWGGGELRWRSMYASGMFETCGGACSRREDGAYSRIKLL
jgi:hypothetical protein